MRVFDHPNMHNFTCPVCKTRADQPVVLVPIPGTEQGNIAEAEQVHKECYDLFIKMLRIEEQADEQTRTTGAGRDA